MTDVNLPKNIQSGVDWSYACPTNKERNAISAGVFKQHVLNTHPSVESLDSPPNHTIVIEGDFQTSTKMKSSSLKVNNTLRHCILTTCEDDNIKYGSHKHADPVLCLYTGINLICVMSNEKMEESHHKRMELFAPLFLLKSNKVQHHMYGVNSMEKRCGR